LTQSSLNTAKFLLKRRKYSKAITLLESNQELYLEDFDYYLTLGTACLYAGDIGNAYNFYQHAREIRLSNANLMLGQAAIFLRRGNTDRALQYYLDILNFEPGNKVARNAMEFIRKHGDYNTIYKWVDNGKIKRFYPPIGLNPDIIRNILFAFFIAGTVISTVFFYNPKEKKSVQIVSRDNPSNIEISGEESGELLATDLSSSVVRYFMDEKQISKSLESAMDYYQSYDDNASQVEINRILNSNASATVKQKASRLMDYTKAPTFDSFDSQKEKHYTNYAEIDTNFAPPIKIGCLFHDHPDQRTLKKIGWVSELQDGASLIDVDYDLPNLQQGALFIVPSGIDNSKGRLFRVSALSNSMVYPSSITCEIVPEYEDTIDQTAMNDFHSSDFNLISEEEDTGQFLKYNEDYRFINEEDDFL